MTAAIVLAAGRSLRMGRPKALLPHHDRSITFVAHIIRELRTAGVGMIVVVGRDADAELRTAIDDEDAVLVINDNADAGQLSSLVTGLDVLASARPDAVLVLPVDVPLVSSEVIRLVMARAAATGAAIVRPVHRGIHGHPVLFAASVLGELRSADPAVGARAVVRADPARVVDVEVDDAGVTADVDTAEDYQRLFGRRP